jgi:5-methylcytosine-specific restriction endonuclease McrA
MTRALVLNATYEPLGVVPGRRAAVLVLAEKAELVAGNGTELHSARLAVPVPSVIRLRYFVRVPFHRRASLSRRAVFARDAHLCQYCGRKADSIDHVVPRSRGGAHEWDNVVAACRRCNLHKGDRLLHEAGMQLRSSPALPRQYAWLVVTVGEVPATWEPYLRMPASLSA